MAYQIDFIPVGDNSKSGDAIALRYEMNGRIYVHVVDGGTKESGDTLCDHLLYRYNTTRIDFLILTHGDDDHSSGLRRVLERMAVGAIVMNRPWLYAAEALHLFAADWTVDRLRNAMRQRASILVEVETVAKERGIAIYEAFAGATFGAFRILAPTRERYIELLPHNTRTPVAAEPIEGSRTPAGLFRGLGALGQATDPTAIPALGGLAGLDTRTFPQRTPNALRGLAGLDTTTLPSHSPNALAGLAGAIKALGEFVLEAWDIETLSEHVPDSPSNEVSVIQYAEIEGHKILLTGDANARALHAAADFSHAIGIVLPGLHFMQMPHHGSRRNVSPSSLNRWLGPPRAMASGTGLFAIASVGAGSETHPRRVVSNAYIRRGFEVSATKGKIATISHVFAMHAGWEPATTIGFSTMVEGA